MRRVLAAMVAVAAGGALLAGCGSDAVEPSGLSSESSTPSPTPTTASPTPTPSATSSDPTAFVHQYVEAANRALTKGDVDQMAALSGPDCAFCSQTAASMKTFYANGGSYEGDASWHIDELGKPNGTDPVSISVYIKVKPHKVISKRGASPEPEEGRTLLFDFTLAKGNGQWKVKDLVVN
ncbi:hypothetical protein [Actinopolymorpha pittospori]